MKAETNLQVSQLAVDELTRFLELLLVWITRQSEMRASNDGRKRITGFDVMLSEKTLRTAIDGLV